MSEKVFNEIGVIPQYDESGGRVPALPETFNPHFVATQQNFDFLEPIIQDVLGAKGNSASLADRMAGVDKSIGDLNTTSAVAVSKAQLLAWAASDEGFSFELFGDAIHTWRNIENIAVTRTVKGDDSVDVESTSRLVEGSSYVIFDDDGAESIVVSDILTSTRFKATASLTKNRTSGTLGLTNWKIESGYAIAPAGSIFYSKPLDVLRYWSDGIVGIRRDNGAGQLNIFARKIGSSEWQETEFESNELASDGNADYRYRIPVGGKVELKIMVSGAEMRIEHMMLLTSPQAGRAPAIEQGVNISPADGAVNQMDPLTVKASVARSLFGKDMASCTFLFYSDAEGKNLVHTGVVENPTGEPEYTAPGGTYGENGIGSWQYFYTDIDGAVSAKSPLTGFSMSDVFQFTQTPTMIAPVADAEISATGATIVLDTMQVEPGGVGEHVASQYRLTSDAAGLVTVYDSGEVADLLSHVVSAALDRGIKLYAWARQKDAVRGWSAWVGGVPFMTEVIGHGVRVDGGIALGPYLWVDGVVGWMIVAPASQRNNAAWASGSYITDDSPLDNLSGSNYLGDSHTGAENTAIIINDLGSLANHPAFALANAVSFEGRSNYFLPSIDELKWVMENKGIIDSVDESENSYKFATIGNYSIWSSSELDNDDAVRFRGDTGQPSLEYKGNSLPVIPVARQEIATTVERVPGGIKVGPYPFADGELGYLVVSPGSQRFSDVKWGLYNTYVPELNSIYDAAIPDTKTGSYNTSILVSSSYNGIVDSNDNVGSPAATICANFNFEGHSDYFLPSKEELKFILANKDAIDAVDDTGENLFSYIKNLVEPRIHSSTKKDNSTVWGQYSNKDYPELNNKVTPYWVVPCRRIVGGA